MDEDGLELPFSKVGSYKNERKGLKLRGGWKGNIAGIGVDVGSE